MPTLWKKWFLPASFRTVSGWTKLLWLPSSACLARLSEKPCNDLSKPVLQNKDRDAACLCANPPSMAVVEMFETMAEIEGVCGRLAAQRATQNSITCLEAANEQCTRAIENADADAYSRHNEAFHCHIYSLAGNAFLEGEARRLFARLKPFRRIQFQMHERMSQSLADHNAIISAITIGDCDTTADILRRHIGSQGERFYQQMAVLRRTAANRNTT